MKGVEAERYIREAREEIAGSLKVKEKEIVFTSGGTESNNMALIGAAMAARRKGNHLITTCIEHASVYNTMSLSLIHICMRRQRWYSSDRVRPKSWRPCAAASAARWISC